MNPSEFSAPMSTADGAIRLWTELVRGFNQAGYPQAVPEYLRLSRLLVQTRLTELLQGETAEPAHWARIRRLGAEAVALLKPLLESAELLAELPAQQGDVQVSASPVPAQTSTHQEPEGESAEAAEYAKKELTKAASGIRGEVQSAKAAPDVSAPPAPSRKSSAVEEKKSPGLRRASKAKERRKSTRKTKNPS